VPKLLALCSAIDLEEIGGCTPFYWSLFAALSRLGIDITIMPFFGRAVQSLWWNIEENPVRTKSLIDSLEKTFALLSKFSSSTGLAKETSEGFSSGSSVKKLVVKSLERKSAKLWLKAIENALSQNKFDIVGMFCPPAHIMAQYVSYLRSKYNVPIFLYEADFPTYLFDTENFRRSLYSNVDIRSFDAVIVNSEGVIPKLKNMGIKKTFVLDFGADINWLSYPLQPKDIDVSFYGYGSNLREEAIKNMITLPSKRLTDRKFVLAGNFEVDTGDASRIGKLNNIGMKRLCYQSKISLNITRKTFAETVSSSTARLFELAAMGTCTVSNPCKGIDKWFQTNKEIVVVHDADEAASVYDSLLRSQDARESIGKNARERVLHDHSYDQRAIEFQKILDEVIT
jgi:spore maturation protein CgeB